MPQPYDVTAVEEKWQRRWRDEGTYEVDNDDPRPPVLFLRAFADDERTTIQPVDGVANSRISPRRPSYTWCTCPHTTART